MLNLKLYYVSIKQKKNKKTQNNVKFKRDDEKLRATKLLLQQNIQTDSMLYSV